MLRSAFVLLAASSLFAPGARAGVLVVAADGSGDFTTVAAAAAAAVDGDVVLIRPGAYNAFTSINGKALTLVGDPSGAVLMPRTSIANLPSAKTLVFRHLTWIDADEDHPAAQLSFFNNDGAILFEDCVFEGHAGLDLFQGFIVAPGTPGLTISDSTAVTLVRCTATGGAGLDTAISIPSVTSRGGEGLVVAGGARVAAHECVLAGGRGGDGGHAFSGSDEGSPGGAGALVQAGLLFTGGGSVTGGDGGDSGETSSDPTLNAGGAAIALAGAGTELRTLAASLQPGAGGGLAGGGTANPGQPIDAAAGAVVVVHEGPYRGHFVSGPLFEGQPGVTSITGQPGDGVAILLGTGGTFLPMLGKSGVLSVAPPFIGPLFVGAVPASGQLNLNFVAPNLGPFGLQAFVLLEQSVQFTPAGTRLGGVSSFLVLDDALAAR